MTEDSREPGRIDLRAFDEPADPARAERAIGAALARASYPRSVGGAASDRPGRRVAALFGAAALLLLAAGLLVFAPRRPPESAPGLVAGWTLSSHIPTNAELLAAFGGYRQ
jgi:nitrate/nitrite transporter NarK